MPSLSITGDQFDQLYRHVFPEDGLEAVAILLCGRRGDERLVGREVCLIPYDVCQQRLRDSVTWPTDVLIPILERAAKENLSIVKVHSHPEGFPRFSSTDDASDSALFPELYEWFEAEYPHASIVMLPKGRVFGRIVGPTGDFTALDRVTVVSDEIRIWSGMENSPSERLPEFKLRTAQAFGAGTTRLLSQMSIAVVGCSGTGSPTVEMLARLGVGRLVLVDPDKVEEKNLNRIIHARMKDAREGRFKVHVLADAVEEMGLGTIVEAWPRNVIDREVVKAIAGCDLVFGCVDGVEGRWLLNKLCAYYVLPYIDVGVRLDSDGRGGISEICGSVHYLRPGRSSLLSRGLVTGERLKAEGKRRINPEEYESLLREKYIKGVNEDRPAVISVNMQLASMAVNELLARLHDYRDEPNSDYARVTISISQVMFYPEAESGHCKAIAKYVGRGDVEPLLGNAELSEAKNAPPV